MCISSLIQTGIVTIQSWTSVTEVNLSPLTPRQEFCVVFPDQMLWCPKLSAPYEPQIPTSFYPHCLSTALSASYSLDFFLLLAKKKKKGHLGKKGHKCWLAFLYFIPLPDLCPKIFHCSVNSRRPSNICPVVFISSCSQEECWILFHVCDRLHAKITQILHSSLHSHPQFIDYQYALLQSYIM